jgi:hypothetical protein
MQNNSNKHGIACWYVIGFLGVLFSFLMLTGCNAQTSHALTSAEQAKRAAADNALARAKAIAMANTGFVTRIQKELADRRFDALDADLDKLDAAFQRDPAFETLYLNVLLSTGSCIKDYDPTIEQAYNAWVKAEPSDPWAYAMRASYYFHAACRSRGAKWASEVKQQQWQGMRHYTQLSLEDLKQAIRFGPKLMPPYELAINILSEEGAYAKLTAFYKRAHSAVPSSYLIAETYMNSLEPRWGGSWQSMQQFGDQIAQEADRNPRFWTFQGSVDADMADSFYRNKDYSRAFQYYDAALKYGDDTDWLKSASNAATGIKDYDAALKYDERIHVYDQALNQDPIYQDDKPYCVFHGCPPSKNASFPWRGEQTKLPTLSGSDVL